VGLGHSPSIVMNGLVLALDAGNTKSYPRSGTTWTNLLGSGNNGTLTNGPTYSSANGGSIAFDGSNDYVNLGTPTALTALFGTSAVSVEVWLRRLANITSQKIVFDSGSNEYIQIDIISNQLAFSIGTPSSIRTARSATLDLNVWYNFVGVYNGSTITSYLNSAQSSQVSKTGNIATDSGGFLIASYTSGSYHFTGNIAAVKVYNRALSAAEVAQNYNALAPRFAVPSIVTDGLVLNLDAGNTASYPGSGTTWTDISGNGNTGTLTNGPTYSSADGGSIVFDGVDDRVDCGNLNTLSNMTVQMFVKPLSNSGGYKAFIGAVGGTGQDYDSGFNIDMGPNSTSAFNYCNFEGGIYRIGGGSNFMTSSIPFGTWVSICFTISPTYIQYYVNGIAQLGANRLNNSTTTIGMNNLMIGRRPYSGGVVLNGNIANTQIYNRALSATEVSQNFEALRGRFGI
jgi:hypothetical protein